MPRDPNGNYTLPAGNPVIPNTTIESTWANTTMDDIANELTNSLSRTGEGGMLAPFKFADGDATNPSGAFTDDPNTGFYRVGNDIWSLVAGGTDIVHIANAVVEIFKTLCMRAGVDQTFKNDAGSATLNGAYRLINDSGNEWKIQKRNVAGDAWIDALSFDPDENTLTAFADSISSFGVPMEFLAGIRNSDLAMFDKSITWRDATGATVNFELVQEIGATTNLKLKANVGPLQDFINLDLTNQVLNILNQFTVNFTGGDITFTGATYDFSGSYDMIFGEDGELLLSNSAGSTDPANLGVGRITQGANGVFKLERSDGAGAWQTVMSVAEDQDYPPETPHTPTLNNHLANKAYVDNAAAVRCVGFRYAAVGNVIGGTLPAGWVLTPGASTSTVSTNDGRQWHVSATKQSSSGNDTAITSYTFNGASTIFTFVHGQGGQYLGTIFITAVLDYSEPGIPPF